MKAGVQTAMTAGARVYVAGVVLIGTAALTTGLSGWEGLDWSRFLTIGMIACVAAGLKVSLPGVTGTMSVNFLFVLLAIADSICLSVSRQAKPSGWRLAARHKSKGYFAIAKWTAMVIVLD